MNVDKDVRCRRTCTSQNLKTTQMRMVLELLIMEHYRDTNETAGAM